MTSQQIRVVLLTAESGSISSAAKILNISQPNASNSIRVLEEEIGFPIFSRSSTGITLTKKGVRLLDYFRQILIENEKILSLKDEDEVYQLRVGGVNYYTAIEPFLQLCIKHSEDKTADFRYYSVSVAEGIQELKNHNLDIVIAPVMKHQVTGLIKECKQNHILMNSVCEIPSVICVRKNHPAALDGRCKKIVQGSDILKEYPYVAFRNLFEDTGSTAYHDENFIQSSYTMYVDEVDVRLRLVSETNAFCFGICSSDRLMKRYGLVAFPVSGISLEMFALVRPVDSKRREITEYMELLKKELNFLLK